MKGASIPPRRPMKDDSPDAWVIMLVGNSSGVTKKTAPNVPDAPTMPSIADTTDSVLRAGIYVPDAPTMPSSKIFLMSSSSSAFNFA